MDEYVPPINIVIPAAGKGQRFRDAGYTASKPLISILGKPMIHRVMLNLAPKKSPFQFIVITRKEDHIPGTFQLDHETDGSVSTILEARDMIGMPELIIANCDQLILDFDVDDFIEAMRKDEADAGAVTFNSTNPHHSYVKTKDGKVVEVAEKKVISDNAVAGVYYYKNGNEFIHYALTMIDKDIRTNGEFYISPIFNEYLHDGGKVAIYPVDVDQKQILGTPEELQIFLDKVEDGRITLEQLNK